MLKNEVEAIRISRLLTPEHQSELLAWVHLAHTAENSVYTLFGIGTEVDAPIRKQQDYSCRHTSKKTSEEST